MNPRISRLFVILLVVLFMVAAVNLFTPFLGKALLGPTAGFSAPGGAGGIGLMSFAMMREARAMVDVESEFDYMARMIPHHQEAVNSAQVLHEYTEGEKMRSFAEEIIATQTQEIGQMESWLGE